MNHRWVVYATFDAQGRPAPHVVDQLRAYRDAGFETFVVDASPSPSAQRAAAWTQTATDWSTRENVGYDFGSYRYGLGRLVELGRIDIDRTSLVLANDSCMGPFAPIVEVIEGFERRNDGRSIFGITDSEERAYHLQSYCLFFPAGSARLALNFLSNLRASADRADAIATGELGLSRHAIQEGYTLRPHLRTAAVVARFAAFRCAPLAVAELVIRRLMRRPKYNEVADDACLKFLLRRPTYSKFLNVTLGFGLQLAKVGMSPFVKRELLRANPYRDRRVPERAEQLDNEALATLLASLPTR